MSKPQNRFLTGMGSAASKSRGQNFAQGAKLLQNQWVGHILPHRQLSLLMFHSLLQHPCTERCPSKTWARWRNRGKTSPWTAACLWPSASWCWPQASRSFMVTSAVFQGIGISMERRWRSVFWQRQCRVRGRWRKRRMWDWESDDREHYNTGDRT